MLVWVLSVSNQQLAGIQSTEGLLLIGINSTVSCLKWHSTSRCTFNNGTIGQQQMDEKGNLYSNWLQLLDDEVKLHLLGLQLVDDEGKLQSTKQMRRASKRRTCLDHLLTNGFVLRYSSQVQTLIKSSLLPITANKDSWLSTSTSAESNFKFSWKQLKLQLNAWDNNELAGASYKLLMSHQFQLFFFSYSSELLYLI